MSTLASYALTSAHLKAIGLVAAEWAYTEVALEQLIWLVADIKNDLGYAITTHIGSETRIHILGAIADHFVIHKDVKKEMSSVVAELRRLRTERNNVVHAVWLSSRKPSLANALKKRGGRRPTPKAIKITAKGKVNITQKPMPSKSILKIATEIGVLLSRMYRLHDTLEDPKWKPRPYSLAALAEQSQ